jgi:hypothetical protein
MAADYGVVLTHVNTDTSRQLEGSVQPAGKPGVFTEKADFTEELSHLHPTHATAWPATSDEITWPAEGSCARHSS